MAHGWTLLLTTERSMWRYSTLIHTTITTKTITKNKVENHLILFFFPLQVQQDNASSTISQYRALSLLRSSNMILSRGWFCYVWNDANVFAYLRELDGLNKGFLVVLNFGRETTTDLSSVKELPDSLTVHLSTVPISQTKFPKSRIPTSQGQGLLLEYSSSQKFHPNHQSECYVSEKACYLPALDILYQC